MNSHPFERVDLEESNSLDLLPETMDTNKICSKLRKIIILFAMFALLAWEAQFILPFSINSEWHQTKYVKRLVSTFHG